MYLTNTKESLKYTVVRLRELSLPNRKKDDKAKQSITQSGKCKKKRKHKFEEAMLFFI